MARRISRYKRDRDRFMYLMMVLWFVIGFMMIFGLFNFSVANTLSTEGELSDTNDIIDGTVDIATSNFFSIGDIFDSFLSLYLMLIGLVVILGLVIYRQVKKKKDDGKSKKDTKRKSKTKLERKV